MALSTQPYKGTRDFYPEEMRVQQWMFGQWSEVVESFGYLRYDGPMLEPFELYAAKTGEEIVNQQLYWLMDRGERKLAVRPEMTPTLARMVAAKLGELARPIRLYSIPNLWRYERPQRGRLREHWQLNVDVLGGDTLLADAEILAVGLSIMRKIGGEKHVVARVSHRGLLDFFFRERLGLSPEMGVKTSKALDARDKLGEEAFNKWLTDLGLSDSQQQEIESFFDLDFESISKAYPCPAVEHLKGLFEAMRQSGLGDQVKFDPTIIRGFDYYTGTVFEIYDTSPENRRAMFGGGRYDNLMGIFGKEALSGVGFGMGDVTLRNFLEVHQLLPQLGAPIDVMVTLPKSELRGTAETLARSLREVGLKVSTPLAVGGFGAQLKLAARHGVGWVALFGESELAEGKVLLKHLPTGKQESVPLEKAADLIVTHKKGS